MHPGDYPSGAKMICVAVLCKRVSQNFFILSTRKELAGWRALRELGHEKDFARFSFSVLLSALGPPRPWKHHRPALRSCHRHGSAMPAA